MTSRLTKLQLDKHFMCAEPHTVSGLPLTWTTCDRWTSGLSCRAGPLLRQLLRPASLYLPPFLELTAARCALSCCHEQANSGVFELVAAHAA